MVDQTRLKQLSRLLRSFSTQAEQRLWYHLRRKNLEGLKFYRQKVIGPFIVDFYCPLLKLIVEADGGGHFEQEQMSYDLPRTQWLESRGYIVQRFTNTEVLEQTHEVLLRILVYRQLYDNADSYPLPPWGEG